MSLKCIRKKRNDSRCFLNAGWLETAEPGSATEYPQGPEGSLGKGWTEQTNRTLGRGDCTSLWAREGEAGVCDG